MQTVEVPHTPTQIAWTGSPDRTTCGAAILIRMIRTLMDRPPTVREQMRLQLFEEGFSEAQVTRFGDLATSAFSEFRIAVSVGSIETRAEACRLASPAVLKFRANGNWSMRDIVTRSNAAMVAFCLVEILTQIILCGPREAAR